MSFTRSWIATLTEQCLSSYLQGSAAAGFRWEDDGSNIRFVDYFPTANRQALIANVSLFWLQVDIPRLTILLLLVDR